MDSLEQKYETEDVGTKKFIVSWLFEFKMVDTKPCINHVTHLCLLLQRTHDKRMELTEVFQVINIIEKLPSLKYL